MQVEGLEALEQMDSKVNDLRVEREGLCTEVRLEAIPRDVLEHGIGIASPILEGRSTALEGDDPLSTKLLQ